MENSPFWLHICPTHSLFSLSFPAPSTEYILFQFPSGSLVAHFYSDIRWDWWKYQETWDDGICRLDRDCRSVVSSFSWMLVISSNDEIPFASMLNCSETERSLPYIKLLIFFFKTACCILPQLLVFKLFHTFFPRRSSMSPSAKVFYFPPQD